MMQLWLREPEVYRLSEEGLQLARALLASFRGSPLKTELKTPGNPGGPADRPPPAG
jgi:TetR/AcrR family acrAB operon transcriptional repressor